MTTKTKLIISFILITLGISCRLLPHIWNFAPIMAIVLFSAVYLGRKYAIAVPLITILLSDIFLGFYEWQMMLTVYTCYLLVGLVGLFIKKYKNAETVLAGSIVASVIFFLATNWAVWQFSPWYAKSIEGLIQCYTLALPFFRNSLLGNIFYTGVLFGSYELVVYLAKQKSTCLENKL